VTFTDYALSILDLSLCQYDSALGHALKVHEQDPVYRGTLVLPDLIEAAVRSGRRDIALGALERLITRAQATGTSWARGLLAQAHALVADDNGAEPLYQQALDDLSRTRVETHKARARLLYGEWLRRRRRRRDARAQLQQAYDMFLRLGAATFAQRALSELQATGLTARRRHVGSDRALTPQELRVARLAATGASNAEIAAQLFISKETVDYHLRKVYRKLDLRSRRQLAHYSLDP
jgi:DNA-binding CsgD family transcriptional regulator